jgi:hypothetical protein
VQVEPNKQSISQRQDNSLRGGETMAVPKISDEELWEIIGWQPPSTQERGWSFSGTRATDKDDANDAPSPGWIEWAKAEIQSARKTYGLLNSDTSVFYLCRLVRVLEVIKGDSVFPRKSFDDEHLRAVFTSGLAASGIDIERIVSQQFDYALSLAKQRGFVATEDVDEWRPGMASGSGWKRYIRLTVAGRLAASKKGNAMPEPYPSDTASEPGGQQDSVQERPWQNASSEQHAPAPESMRRIGAGEATEAGNELKARPDGQEDTVRNTLRTESETSAPDHESAASADGGPATAMHGIIGLDEKDRLVLNRDALPQQIAVAPKRSVKKGPAKRTTRATAIDAIKAAMREHLRSAKQYAYETKERQGSPDLLPHPTQKQLAKLLELSDSSVSRALNDGADKELRILWDGALHLDYVMRFKG